MTSSPLFNPQPQDIYGQFMEEDSFLPSAPSSPNVEDTMDHDAPRRRRSGKKAARVLGFSLCDEDLNMGESDLRYATRSDVSGFSHGADGRRASLSQLNLSSLSLRDTSRGYAPDATMSEDGAPLLNGTSSSKRPRVKKAYKRLGKTLLGPFRLGKAPPGKARKRTLSGGSVPPPVFSNPFDDRHGMDLDGGEPGAPSDVEMAGQDERDAPGSSMAPPKTPRRAVRYASAPTTPRTSPPSAKSRRSVASWQRSTPHTPLSAKSWRSDTAAGSSPGSDFSPSSGGSARLRKAKRLRARDLASQSKAMQLLGPEASAAVAKATNVKETKLRYRDFGRQLHERLKRDL